jgi:hypothetical protein
VSFHNLQRFKLPYSPDPQALIADAGPDIPGGLGANKGYWMKQLRNPANGQWVEMGHLVEFHIKLKDGSIVKEFGIFEGSDGTNARVRVEGGKHAPDGYYHPEAHNVNPRAQAQIGEDYLDKKGLDVEDTIDPKYAKYAQTLEELDPELGLQEKKSAESGSKSKLVSGDAAIANIRATAAKQAKAEGRFPVMRNGKDAERAAEEQYKSIFEAFKKQHPEFNEHFADANEYWDYVKSHAVDTTTKWSDDHTDIDPIMRASNQTYAQEILGVEPNGMIEFYRNAVNHKDSQENSAAGYISLDRRMAWDYNARKTEFTNEHDGRYIVRVKPDEVSGALGYSKAEDEFGVVVGPDITSIPGRIQRVGDLEIQTITPYIDDTKTFDRSGGGSPFRHFSTASQFDFYTSDQEVLPGEKFADFYAANNLETGAIPAKYDELYGKGSFESDKAQFGSPQYSRYKDLFVKTPDGEYGIDPKKLDEIRYQAGSNDSGELYEHYLKMLSTIQELHGEPFMVSNAHSLNDPRLDPTPDAPKTTILKSVYDGLPEDFTDQYPMSSPDIEDMTQEQYDALQWFTDAGYEAALDKADGKAISPEHEAMFTEITQLIDSSKTPTDQVLWRGVTITNPEYSDSVDNYKPGMVVTSKTFNSHSEDSDRALFYAKMDIGSEKHPLLQRVVFRTHVPKGTKAYRIPDEASSYGASEKEVVFHPDSRYEIVNVSETVDGLRVVDMRILPPEDKQKAKPAVPSPAMMAKNKAPAPAPKKPKSLDFPSETRVKPSQKTVTALDGNSQPVKQGDKVSFYLERDGKPFKVEGEYLGVSLGSLSGKEDANKPFIRITGQDGIKDGDYPIRSDVLNLGPGDSNFRDTRTPLASTLEREQHVPDATRLTQLNKEEFDAVFAYTTENAFDDVRLLMEKHPGKTLDDIKKTATSEQDQKTLQQIKLIEDAIYNSPLPADKKLYRGMEFLDDADFELAIKSLKVGEPIYDASIVSTSSDPKVAEKFTGGQGIIFEIDAPEGSPALETPWFYNNLSLLEDEYMLPRNSEFEITEIGDLQDGVVRVKVKYRPPLTRQAQGIQTPQLTKPKYQTFNEGGATETPDGDISVPDSPEAQDLATLGSWVPDQQLKEVDTKTRELFTPDAGYKPFDPGLATSKQMESLNDLTPTGESAFKYVDSSLAVNRLLRQRDAATEVSDDVKRLDEAILISEHLPPGATVYRMMKLKRWKSLDVKPGQVIFDRGFMSTTMTPDYVDEILGENKAAKKVLQVPMKIVMPNNTSGISLRPISWFTNENEYLLPRNTALRFLGWDSQGAAVFERVT